MTSVNTFGADGLVSRRDVGSGASLFYTFGPRGDACQKLSAGGVRATELYDGFGYRYALDKGVGDPWGFGAQWGAYTDAETGLVLMTHRFYDPDTGRFLTRDPAGYAGGVNLYAYAQNNPVNDSDPSGFAAVVITGCSPAEKVKIEKAVRDVCDVRVKLLQNPKARKCAYYSCQQSIYIKCVSNDPSCNQGGKPDCSYASGNNNDVIHLCRDNGAISGGACGCLSKTILFEMINNCGYSPGKDSPIAPCSNQPFGPGYPPCP